MGPVVGVPRPDGAGDGIAGAVGGLTTVVALTGGDDGVAGAGGSADGFEPDWPVVAGAGAGTAAAGLTGVGLWPGMRG